MTTGTHAIVWIDSTEAVIMSVDRESTREIVVRADAARHHMRSKTGNREGYRATADHVFFQRVANDLDQVKSFAVIGPAQAKTEFVKHLHQYDPRLFPRLAAVESAERMSEGELADYARHYFARADQIIRPDAN